MQLLNDVKINKPLYSTKSINHPISLSFIESALMIGSVFIIILAVWWKTIVCLQANSPSTQDQEKEELAGNGDAEPLLKSCGISITSNFTQVEGRVLPAPRLKVKNGEDFFPRNGRWNFNNKKLVNLTTIEKWAVVNFSARCDIRNLVRDLIKCGGLKGIALQIILIINEVNHDELETTYIVLIHRGGFGAWCSYKTIALLQECEIKVTAVDLSGFVIDRFDSNAIKSLSQYVKPLADFLEMLLDEEKGDFGCPWHLWRLHIICNEAIPK
nr:protein argonaute 4 [Tanacetum cinerariifolium]